ncbi:phage holin family protein [Paenibacillus sp. RC84]|uniref:phage holin family protein n=1 Tax=Paenibacillus sp. RC84 TaxID=3156252 RepID=UPI003515A1D0
MTWDTVINLIDSSFLTVLAACWILGFVLKNTPRFPNWAIVYVVSLIAVSFTVWIKGFAPETVLQGILCGAVAVYGYQLVKQAKKGVDEA